MADPLKNIVCIGEVLWDVLGEVRKPGGAPMNVAVHLSRLNHPVRMVSRVGKDKNGNDLLDFLSETGLDTSYIQLDPELPTGEVLVTLDEQNNATYQILEPVAWDRLESGSRLEQLARQAGMIVYGSLASRNSVSRKTISGLLNSHAIKLMDVNLRSHYTRSTVVQQLLEKADIAKLNEEELQLIAGWDDQKGHQERALMKWITKRYQLQSVVVTRGADGAIVYENHVFCEHPGYRIRVADTVGAGDAFLAGFISSMLNGATTKESLDFACATGAYVATQSGATPAYHMNDIMIIKNNPASNLKT